MEKSSDPIMLGITLFILLFIYLLWKKLLADFNYKKVFDISFSFIFWGLILDRILYVAFNLSNLIQLPWGFNADTQQLPWRIINLDYGNGFSWIIFLLGGYLGIVLYNAVNSTYRVELEHLDILIKVFFIAVLPYYLLNLSQLFTLQDKSEIINRNIYWILLQTTLLIVSVVLYQMRIKFWKNNPGIFSGLTILGYSFVEIVIAFQQVGFTPQVLGIFSLEQIFALIILIIALSIIFSSISIKQDQIIRKSNIDLKQPLNRGFNISFANRRRVSNPLNIRLKNLTQNVSKNRRNK